MKAKKIIEEPENNKKKVPKKRGRKPKGGKIISKNNNMIVNNFKFDQNIILHLKCTTSDLDDNDIYKTNSYNPTLIPIKPMDSNFLNNNNKNETMCGDTLEINSNKPAGKAIINNINSTGNIDTIIKDKLEILEKTLHHNVSPNANSCCFWCTCEFKNPDIYIPKYKINDAYQVYGCFCTPECATGYLMNELIDESTKFERYHLLNFIYGKIFDYTRYFKPAPNPHYTLDKYCGNLTIEEYRKSFYSDEIIIVTEKPLTRVMPELHEDTHLF
jgi:hypothetical protein